MASDADFRIKSHDRLPVIRSSLTTGAANAVVDLTLANSVRFIMRPATDDWLPIAGAATVDALAQVVTPLAGIVEYAWIVGDTAVVGRYVGEWEVTWSNLKPQTFPTDSYHTIEIVADLGGAA